MLGSAHQFILEDYDEAYHILYQAAIQFTDDPLKPWKGLEELTGITWDGFVKALKKDK